MQLAQLGAGLDPRVVDEPPARGDIGLERLGLAAGSVQREHALRVEPLAQRMLVDQALELRQRFLVASGGEVAVDGELRRPEPQLVEPPDLGTREGLTADVGQRGAAPQREGFASGSVRRPVSAARLLDEALEAATSTASS